MANAILDGTDAVMLSQETAVGAYPVEAVAMMAAVAEQAESIAPYERWNQSRVRRTVSDPAYTIAHNLCDAARELRLDALVIPTLSGRSARLVSAHRPTVPIYALSPGRETVRRCGLMWGVQAASIAASRDDRGADRRRRAAGRRARLVPARASAWASPRDCPRGGPARPACSRSRCSRAVQPAALELEPDGRAAVALDAPAARRFLEQVQAVAVAELLRLAGPRREAVAGVGDGDPHLLLVDRRPRADRRVGGPGEWRTALLTTSETSSTIVWPRSRRRPAPAAARRRPRGRRRSADVALELHPQRLAGAPPWPRLLGAFILARPPRRTADSPRHA